MALYWAAQNGPAVAQAMSTQAQYTWAAAFTAVGWVVAGLTAYWQHSSTPELPSGWIIPGQWCYGDGAIYELQP